MLELPEHGEGLSWIARQDLSELLLMPGLQAESITAAVAGDPEALSHLYSTIQQVTAMCSCRSSNDLLDKICREASKFTSWWQEDALFKRLRSDGMLYESYGNRKYRMQSLLKTAAPEGELEALLWLQGLCPRNWDNDEIVMAGAASRGQLKILKHLRLRPDPVPWWLCTLVYAASHADCLAWLLLQEEPCPCGSDTLGEIAATGNLPLMEHLRLHHHKYVPVEEWDMRVSQGAAEGGQLAILQWLRCQLPVGMWDEGICRAAASRGNLAMLQWAQNEDPPAPWGTSVTKAAARGEWLCNPAMVA